MTSFVPYNKIEEQLVIIPQGKGSHAKHTKASIAPPSISVATVTNTDRDFKQVRQWAVTEKVHGANFSFIYHVASDAFQFAKRNGILNEDDKFFQYQRILPSVIPKIRQLCTLVLASPPIATHIETITVYGELFGGLYPMPEGNARSIEGITPVQRGVYYSPSLHFMAFDIRINESLYLDFQDALGLFRQVDGMRDGEVDGEKTFHYAAPLAFYPSYATASEYRLGFDSTIPSRLGLPPLPKGSNKAEGIVIRSMTKRFLTKLKIVEFAETETAELYSNNSMSKEELQTIGLKMVTENRLNSAISKIGSLEDYRYQVYEEVCEDILRELRVDTSHAERKPLKNFFLTTIKSKFASI